MAAPTLGMVPKVNPLAELERQSVLQQTRERQYRSSWGMIGNVGVFFATHDLVAYSNGTLRPAFAPSVTLMRDFTYLIPQNKAKDMILQNKTQDIEELVRDREHLPLSYFNPMRQLMSGLREIIGTEGTLSLAPAQSCSLPRSYLRVSDKFLTQKSMLLQFRGGALKYDIMTEPRVQVHLITKKRPADEATLFVRFEVPPKHLREQYRESVERTARFLNKWKYLG